MDGEKPLADQPGEGGTSRPAVSTNFTSEAFRIELRDGERPNSFQAQESLLTSQSGTQSIQKKKTPSFQITSVVPNDGGEESPDETEDMSDILDSSKIEPDSEKETPSFSEEYSKSEDVGTANELPSSTQYGITAVVQQNQSGGLLTSRLPPGITVNVTKGGIALAEADGVVPNDADNLSNRFKIVKIASNKPFKKGRWVCFDFMDSPATSAVGVRGAETPNQASVAIPLAPQPPLNQGQPITNQQVPQQMMHIQQNQHVQQQHSLQSAVGQQQYGSNQTGTMNPVPSAYPQMSTQTFQPMTSSTMTSVTQKNLQLNMQQQQLQHLHHQQMHQMHQQQQMQQQTQSSGLPSQVLDSQQMGSISQASVSSNVNESSPIVQAVSAVNVMQQQLKNNQDSNQPQKILQQPLSQGIGTSMPSNQSMMSQPPQQYQPMPPQHIQQPPQSHQSQHVISSQQQAVTQMQVPSQQQQQQQPPMNQEQINAVQDQSPNSHSTPNYHPSQQQSQMVSQPVNFSAQAQSQQSTTQASQLTTAQQQSQQTVPPSQGPAQVPQGSLVHTCGMSSFVSAPSQTTTATSMGSSASFSSQMKASAAAAAAQMVSGQIIPSIVPEATEGTSEQGGASDENTPGDEDKTSASTASTVAIDNKIEQAMDLVKSHLMFAVREEVDVLKERIGELMERINHLEYENTVLRKYASPEALQQLQHPSANP